MTEARRARVVHDPVADASARIDHIARLVSQLSGPDELAAVGWTVLDEMSDMGATGGHIFLVRQDVRGLELLTARNIPSPLLEHIRQVGFNASLLAARAATSRRVERLSAMDPTARDMMVNAGQVLRSTDSEEMISVPLSAHGRLFGVLTLTFADATSLHDDDVNVLLAVADVLAQGLAKVRENA